MSITRPQRAILPAELLEAWNGWLVAHPGDRTSSQLFAEMVQMFADLSARVSVLEAEKAARESR